jgi:hypothetical protein
MEDNPNRVLPHMVPEDMLPREDPNISTISGPCVVASTQTKRRKRRKNSLEDHQTSKTVEIQRPHKRLKEENSPMTFKTEGDGGALGSRKSSRHGSRRKAHPQEQSTVPLVACEKEGQVVIASST